MAIGEYRIGELMSDEDSLAHYGVKGMKWGVRKKSGGSNLPASVRFNPGARVGMKIGQAYVKRQTTPDASGVTRRQARQEIRKSDNETNRRLEDFEDSANRSNAIRAARQNTKMVRRNYQDIKDDVKAKKGSGELGKNQAKIIMAKARNERYETVYKAESKTTGEQIMEAFFAQPVRTR